MPPPPGFFGADFIYLLLKSRPEMAQWLKIPAALREDPASIPWWLIIAYNFSPELLGTFFYLLQVPGMHMLHTYV